MHLSAVPLQNKSLRLQLLRMVRRDQGVRRRLWQSSQRSLRHVLVELHHLDRKHCAALKAIIRVHGWPGISLVGKRGVRAAWMIAQHSDHDIQFQKDCLARLEESVAAGDAEMSYLAYLTDRILVHQHKPQLYATQFRCVGTRCIPFPIARRRYLSRRRRRMGLKPFETPKPPPKLQGTDTLRRK